MHNLVLIFCILHSAFCIASCSIPNLESQQCSQARDTVKAFYSWYLGTDTDVKAQHPEIFAKYISKTFSSDRGSGRDWESDPYFLDHNFPTTFKVGACKQIDDQTVNLQVQVYWRDDTKVTQKEVHVEAVKTGEDWLINRVTQ